jgi:hypothetical protein
MNAVAHKCDGGIAMAFGDRNDHPRLVPANRRDIYADLAARACLVVRKLHSDFVAQAGAFAMDLIPQQVSLSVLGVSGTPDSGKIQCAGSVFDMAATTHGIFAGLRLAVEKLDDLVGKLVIVAIDDAACGFELGAGAGEQACTCSNDVRRHLFVNLAPV